MNPLDPAVAALRCWVHEDCLEHPELALACAAGLATEWAAGVAEGTHGAFLTDWSFGDGYGYTNGGGGGVDDFNGEGQDGGGRGSGLSPNDWYVAREHERLVPLDLESCYLATWGSNFMLELDDRYGPLDLEKTNW